MNNVVPKTRVPVDDSPAEGAVYRVQVLEKVFEILQELAEHPEGLGPTDLAGRLPIHRSTVHRLLSVLERAHFVRKVDTAGKYQLGWKLIELGARAARQTDLVSTAKPYLARLANDTGETAHLGVLSENFVVSVANAEGARTLRTPTTVGRRTPAHCSSLGKAILSCEGREEVDAFLSRYKLTPFTARTICNAERFRLELAKVAQRGFALDNEEYEEGLKCIGAPIRDFTGKAIAAISVAGPAGRLDTVRLPGIARQIVRAAEELSMALGFQSAAMDRKPQSQ